MHSKGVLLCMMPSKGSKVAMTHIVWQVARYVHKAADPLSTTMLLSMLSCDVLTFRPFIVLWYKTMQESHLQWTYITNHCISFNDTLCIILYLFQLSSRSTSEKAINIS